MSIGGRLKRLFGRGRTARAHAPAPEEPRVPPIEESKWWIERIEAPEMPTAAASAEFFREYACQNTVDYESMLEEGYSRFVKPGMTAIDIGAHAGFHYSKLKLLVGPRGRVIGFEPLPNFASHILERHNGDAEIIQKALSNEPGRSTFLYMQNAPGESGFKERAYGEGRGAMELEVDISTLDRELGELPECAFIKIDTEGHEILVLEGGRSLISRTRPVIGIEYGNPSYSLYGFTIDSLYDFAESLDYRLSDLFGNFVTSREEWHQVCDISYWDYFAVPAEKSEWWESLFADPKPSIALLRPVATEAA